MSRSNPQENGTPNPATRWFEWNGEDGVIRYYDKEKQERVDVGHDFGFVLLDELGSVTGWDDASGSRIYSNEVKDTRQDVLVVKSFKGGPLVEGLYKAIKDRVNSLGGSFTTNCYIAYKNGHGELSIGSLRLKGAALGAWMDFRHEHRAELYSKGVRIVGVEEGKKGRIVFRVPVFKIVDLTEETNNAAVALDKQLQAYLATYLKKNKRDQAEAVAAHVGDEEVAWDDEQPVPPITDDDIPF